jgi:ketol-acid reductoisomerase
MGTFHDPTLRGGETLRGRRVAVLGFGSQGRSHALNLRESGMDVVVGLRPSSPSRARAADAGLQVCDTEEAVGSADVISFCTPDVPMAEIYRAQVEPHLRDGQTLLFVHGYNIRYGHILPPPSVDVVLVSPKAVGPAVRSLYLSGGRLFGLVAVERDASGRALDTALAYGWAIGCRAGLLATTFAEETETDLFGEQTVLCGGIPELMKAAFETLVEAGYQPEAAYFECVHEAKLIVDLVYERGIAGMRASISDTAEWGGFRVGPEVVNASSRAAMREALARIRDGRFADEWGDENRSGLSRLDGLREAGRRHPLESAGEAIRGTDESPP